MSQVQELENQILTRLKEERSNLSEKWGSFDEASGTRFLVIDDLLTESVVSQIYEDFNELDKFWKYRDTFRERKKTFAELSKASQLIKDITFALQAQSVLDFFSELTEIEELEGDPLLYAGGVSMMEKGDFLNPHIDNSHNIDRKLYRKFNALFYVTPNWQESFGGNLELWDRSVTRTTEIASLCNRLVIMETNKESWHSVNEVNVDKRRCCVSNYYFSKGCLPYSKDYYHVTSFQGRPNQKVRRVVSGLDNFARQTVATLFKVSRGKSEVNKVK